MRVLLCGLAVSLMLVASASAAGTGHLTMTVGGSSTYEPDPGETFRVDVVIIADVTMTAWGMEPYDEADAGYEIVASATGGYGGGVKPLNYVDVPGPPMSNAAGWDVNIDTCKQWPGGILNDLQATDPPQVRPGAISEGAVSGWVMFLELTAPATGPRATRIVLHDLYACDLDLQPLTMTYDPLVLTPEPTSALLLLGALPLLRRR